MIIETHVHGRPHKFGISKAETFCRIAKERGIDGLIFTEHSHTPSNGFWNEENTKMLSDKYGILIMIGQELTTDIGHVMAYNYPLIKGRIKAEELKKDDRYALVWAHPLRDGGEKHVPFHLSRFDGMEVMNKKNTPEECRRSMDIAHNYQIAMTAGSDIHLNRHVGICPCYVPPCTSIEDYVGYVKNRNIVPLHIGALK